MERRRMTRESLDVLAANMPIICFEEQPQYVGGLDPNDCIWRCIAYGICGGYNYDEWYAMGIAQAYCSDNGYYFKAQDYAFSGDHYDRFFLTQYVQQVYGVSGTEMIVFETGPDTTHAVIVKQRYSSGVDVFDPQNENNFSLTNAQLQQYGAFNYYF